MAFRAVLPPATLVYMTHSAVVIRFEAASTLRTREKGGGRERPPPQKQGGHAARNENVVDAGESGGTKLWPRELT